MYFVGDVLPLYYQVPENEMKDMDITEMLNAMQIGETGNITVSRTTFNGQSVIKESFYESSTGFTVNCYFNGDKIVGLERTHLQKADELIYIETVTNSVDSDLLSRPKLYIDISGLM